MKLSLTRILHTLFMSDNFKLGYTLSHIPISVAFCRDFRYTQTSNSKEQLKLVKFKHYFFLPNLFPYK